MEEILENLIVSALSKRSTDVHMQIEANKQKILFRSLYGLVSAPIMGNLNDLFEYCKFRSNLDLSMNMIPQTGSFEIIIRKQKVRLRFSAIETYHSKSGVIRILNLHKADSLAELSSDEYQKEFQRLTQLQNGLILFCGSTGSGKSTTMFTWLKTLRNRRIYTIEDPIEQIFDQFMQVQVNSKQGLTFSEAVFQLLRHDPDVIVIGEIRGPTEAKAAIRSAYSGHLVVATIHSASAQQTIYRLMDFEVSKADIEQTLKVSIFQQLVLRQDKKGRGAKFEFIFY
ncbi:MAG: competence protein ComG [Firmicutes bacterium HGW-Firmicutes-10]|jgi:competence protein ComGA|nr:MAG: competence protein ComG [Firmicutes bacterium HGW-Firmicutes-10]